MGGVRVHRRTQVSRRGSAGAAAALVELHDAVVSGIEPLPVARPGALTGTAVQYDGGLAVRVAAHAVIDMVSVADVEPAFVVRLARREGVHAAQAKPAPIMQ